MRRPDPRDDAGVASLQADFARRIFQPGGAPPAGISGRDHAGPPVRRFEVYRNNVLASLTAVVKARYPVILRLLGERFFAGMARDFVERHPPRAPVLSEYGGEFSDFLASSEEVSDLPYLADVARLEWAMHVAHHAADQVPLEPAELGRISADSIAGARLILHPSMALIASPYPVVSIWETNSFDAEVRPIGPGLAGEQALVVRPGLDVRLSRISRATLSLAEALAKGEVVGRAFESAAARAGGDDISQSLAALLGAGAVVDAEFNDSRHGRVMLTSHAKGGT